MMNKAIYSFFLLLCLVSGCYRVPDQIDPKINCSLQDAHLERLKSAFEPLSLEEKSSDWGKEYLIAKAFAERLDLYRAISTFQRAEILLSDRHPSRTLEVQYFTVLCYFLGKRPQEAAFTFEKSLLHRVDPTFPAYTDLLLILYECYRELHEVEKQVTILELLEKSSPETAEKLSLSRALREGNFEEIHYFAKGFQGPSYLSELTTNYEMHKKSVPLAQGLNAIFPGAGYYYIGQKKAAVTSFILNALFIFAAVEFFLHDHIPAGIITTGFEAGWYFGGIYGAGEEAKYYNERLYEKQAEHALNEHKLFPTLMIRYSF